MPFCNIISFPPDSFLTFKLNSTLVKSLGSIGKSGGFAKNAVTVGRQHQMQDQVRVGVALTAATTLKYLASMTLNLSIPNLQKSGTTKRTTESIPVLICLDQKRRSGGFAKSAGIAGFQP